MHPKGIPKHATAVFRGKIFTVWQWQQVMFDGSTKVFEMLSRPNTVEVIATVGDNILIQHEEQPGREPFVTIPGGRCEGDEDPLQAIKRELLEETGYTSNSWNLFGEMQPAYKIVWTIFAYIARDCKKVNTQTLDHGERITSSLVTFDEFLALADNPQFRNTSMVPHLLRMRIDQEAREAFRAQLFG